NFAASDDEWTAPVCAEVGPDGALWVSDWYNYVIQHNPTPRGFRTGKGAAYETPLRDKAHGRIYRIAYNAAQASAGTLISQSPPVRSPSPPLTGERAGVRGRLDLLNASPQQLVAVLKNDNLFWRMTAQRLLVTRGQKDVVSALCDLVRDTQTDEITSFCPREVGRAHAGTPVT